jgi:hypothetical protein
MAPFCAYGGQLLEFNDGVEAQMMSDKEVKTEVKAE